eukprot:SAG11_NODE_62_length_19006_cov_6.513143_8_plen_45_part_00
MIETTIEILGIGKVLGTLWIILCLGCASWALVEYISQKFKEPKI